MSVFVIIHTKVDDIENHHREIVPKIMEAVKRHGGRRIALGHGEHFRVHVGEPPNANRAVIHEFPDHESVERWLAAMSFTPSASSAWSACPRSETNWGWRYREFVTMVLSNAERRTGQG